MQFALKALLGGLIIALVSELAKRNNAAASIIHSLPITSVIAFIFLYLSKNDAELVGRHAQGTFWYVLPTLPMFLVMPWLIKKCGGFWLGLSAGIVMTVVLYYLTMVLLKRFGVEV